MWKGFDIYDYLERKNIEKKKIREEISNLVKYASLNMGFFL